MSQDLPGRMLRLLSLLQTRRTWTGDELTERLDVTLRTIRRDIDRLRELGYPVEGTTGTAGGYRLAAGADLPPLLLDDEEAVAIAIAIALRTATRGVAGIEETAVRALAKLEQVLPVRLRHQVATFQAAAPLPVPWSTGPTADPSTLALLAAACRDHETVTFTYRRGNGETGRCRVEPHALVAADPLWYLVAYDTEHEEWRLFRVDRLTDPAPTGHRVTPRALPAPDAAAYVAERLAAAPARYTLHATVPADAATVRARTYSLPGRVQPVDETTSTLDLAADNPRHIAEQLLGIDLGPAESIKGTPALAPHLERLGRRLLRAARALTRHSENGDSQGTAHDGSDNNGAGDQ
ncbi:helix-turn-helix transcriptional regulator [Streptomyces rimosus]|uniref:helix-turn-helix transcriptional regulator n=1 Tax=Streptomyces rimosus TaxID=1927 RepID=UPI0037CFDC19